MLRKKQSLNFVILNLARLKERLRSKDANGARKAPYGKRLGYELKESVQSVGFFENAQQRHFLLRQEEFEDLIRRKFIEPFDLRKFLYRKAATSALDVRNELRSGVSERIGNIPLRESRFFAENFPLVAVDPSSGLICFEICFAVHASRGITPGLALPEESDPPALARSSLQEPARLAERCRDRDGLSMRHPSGRKLV